MKSINRRSGQADDVDTGLAQATIGRLETTRSIDRNARGPLSLNQLKLTFDVHVDALRSNPVAYLQAVGWRLRGLRLRSRNRMAALAGHSPSAYKLWIAKHEQTIRSAFDLHAHVDMPPILVAVDCSGGSDGREQTVRSVARQEGNVRLVVVGGPKGQDNWVEKPDELANYLSGEDGWLCILRAGDELADGSLSAYGQAIATSPDSTVIYSDDDLIVDPSGCRSSPHFKPSWNSELFEHHDYITGSTVVKINRTDMRDVVDQSWARDLTRKAVQRSRPLHLPLVLHHLCRRSEPDLRATAAPLPDSPRAVSVIIPTRNQCSLLKVCVSGVRRLGYPGVEIVIVDNGSDDPETLAYLSELERAGVRVMRLPGPFNYSALNNAAVKEAKGDLFCFLNNDVEEIEPDWLRPLVAQAVREDVGAVGAQLLYPDGTIQHAGVVTGVGGGAGHAHRFQDPDDLGYFGRANLPQFVTAVTAACLVVERKKFEAVGGFDEIDFPVAFNDVDLCLKLNAHGWQSFYEPRSRLIHHESKSRGDDRAKSNRQRFSGELAALKRKWQTDLHCDPFHHPNLSPFTEQFYVAL